MHANILLVPGIILSGVGLVLGLMPTWLRRACVALLPPLLLIHIWTLPHTEINILWLEHSLTLLRLSSSGMLFASVFLVALWGGGLFALQDAAPRELGAAFIYAGGAIGICLCGDWITLFCFWELMALSSTLIVWCGGQPDSKRAGLRYLLIHLAGGVFLLAGISALAVTGTSMELGPLQAEGYAYWFILAGILFNAGAPPFSFWVADAYPQASPSGMVFLSAFTTKTAVFVLLAAFAGEALLIPLGIYMALYGIVYALLEHDIRRILAYSIVNQVGFMLVAVGVGTSATLNGAHAHAAAHILYKMTLLMGAGTILRQMGTTSALKLGGELWRRMPKTTICILIGAAASMGVPFTSSFITKSVVLTGLADADLGLIWALMLVCSAAVVFNAGGRFPWLALFAPAPDSSAKDKLDSNLDPQGITLGSMVGTALLCLVFGWVPGWFYQLLPYPGAYHPYSGGHLLEQVQILAVAGTMFWLTRRYFYPQRGITLDTDWVLRVALLQGWMFFQHHLTSSYFRFTQMEVNSRMRSYMLLFSLHGPRGILARSWYTGSIALWVALILASYILMYNFSAHAPLNTLLRFLLQS
ncbi:MAG: proton-conducting transporter membrane subunit [Desulfuromonadaceae bacterium]|nr:proton-conducting transporter membrane subunit [Desulfuromonadaceae bacterium]